MRPLPEDYPPYFHGYVSLVKQDEVLTALRETYREALELLRSIPDSLGSHAYAEGKWTIREVFLHCMDTERVFSYRALCFARGDKQRMLPFEENDYAAASNANTRTLADIANEMEAVSQSTLALFSSFSGQVLARAGESPSGRTTVNSMGFMISGHLIHHMSVLRERYLK